MLGIIEPYPIMRNKQFVYFATTIIILGFPIVCFAFVISFLFENHYSLLMLQPYHDTIYIIVNIYFLFLSTILFLMSKATKILSSIAFGLSIVGFVLEIFFITHQHTPMLSQTWFFIVAFLVFGFLYMNIDSVPGRAFSCGTLIFCVTQLWSITYDSRNFSNARIIQLSTRFTVKWSLALLVPLTVAIIGLVIYMFQMLPKKDKKLDDGGTIITY